MVREAFSFAGSITAQPHLRSGKIRLLAVTTIKPAPAFPGTPPLASIYPGFEATNWYAFFAPSATPAAIINRISSETSNALKSSEVRDFLVKEGADAVGSTPQEFAAFFRAEIDRYAQVIKAAGIMGE